MSQLRCKKSSDDRVKIKMIYNILFWKVETGKKINSL